MDTSTNQTCVKNSSINVALVDDHPSVREGIKQFFTRTDHICVVGEADNGIIAQTLLNKVKPDVVLVDIEMPHMSGIEFLEWSRRHHPEVKVIMLSSYDDDAYVLATLKAGAHGYALKNSPLATLIKAVETVYANQSSLDPGITDKVVGFATHNNEAMVHQPSKRELQVLQLVAKGHTNKKIGSLLNISDRTVQGHLSKVFDKLGVATRTEAVTKAVSVKLIEVNCSSEN